MINNEMALVSIAILAGLIALVFWGSMAVHCFKSREGSRKERLPWLAVIVFGKLLGAGAYYLLKVRQPSMPSPT